MTNPPDIDAQRRAAGLKALPVTTAEPAEQNAKPEVVVEDRTLGNEEALRGIPVVGRVSGTMKGTRPGDNLERSGRAILRRMLGRHRYQPAEEETG